MCIIIPLKVKKIMDCHALLEDGRTVRLGLVNKVDVGDYLEVYGDVALGKVMKSDVEK